jgi:O-antigen/teichoic acid export membrane protein
MEASGKFSHSNFALWSGPFLTLALLAALSLGHALSPVTGGLVYVLGNVPSVFWLILHVWREYRPELVNLAATSKSLLHYGLRSWGVDLLNALSGQADQVLIVRFLSPASMGTYVVAASFARLISVFHGSAVMVLFPRVADQSKSEIMLLTGLAARISSACAAVGAICIGLAGPYLLGLLYGSAYVQEGTTVFRVLLLNVVLSGATQILAQAFMASNRPGVVTVIQGIGVGIGLASMPVLILEFGVAGAAAGLLISSGIRLALTLLCFRTILNIPIPSLFPRRSDLAFVAARLRGLLARPELAAV